MNNKSISTLFLGIILATVCTSTSAQVNPQASIYFQNQYLANPAMAGLNKGLNLNLGYKNEWNASDGAPVNQSLTAESRVFKKLGLGIALLNDAAGLLKCNKLTTSLAYHIPLSDPSEHLSFGVSGAWFMQRLNNEEIIANPNDPIITAFQNKKTVFDTDLGLAYSKKNITFQAALYQLKNMLDNNNAVPNEYGLFYVSLRYRWKNQNFSISPILSLRGIRDYQDVIDLGTEIGIADNKIKFSALYHTDQSATAGISYNYKGKFQILSLYHTASKKLTYSTGNTFELAFNLKLFGENQ